MRVNIGCGPTPTLGWLNYDNSLSVRLARHSLIASVIDRLGLLEESQKLLVRVARSHRVGWADATKRIPLPSNSVGALYSSHMAEHLDRVEVKRFLREAYRVLAPSAVIRIAVPDLKKLVERYVAEGDADSFIEGTLLTHHRPTLVDRLKYLIVGARHHFWMYDGASLCRLLSSTGFREPRILEPGSTTIANPGDLDLHERAHESVYVEAIK